VPRERSKPLQWIPDTIEATLINNANFCFPGMLGLTLMARWTRVFVSKRASCIVSRHHIEVISVI
jgi:hypothetical protein